MKILRIFPHRTKATPDDENVRIGMPTSFDEADKVIVSVTFTWDIPFAEKIAEEWRLRSLRVEVGGPAYGDRGDDFIPGMFLKKGYVITSRGCPNKCSFCLVPRREGALRELPITEGWNLIDNNILACGSAHRKAVFEMLSKQTRRPELTGGLESSLITEEIAKELYNLKPAQIFMAYDSPSEWKPLMLAVEKLRNAGFKESSHCLRCYVLIGMGKDTLELAESRLRSVLNLGVLPMAMLWNKQNQRKAWRHLQRRWARPAIIASVKNSIAEARIAEHTKQGRLI